MIVCVGSSLMYKIDVCFLKGEFCGSLEGATHLLCDL